MMICFNGMAQPRQQCPKQTTVSKEFSQPVVSCQHFDQQEAERDDQGAVYHRAATITFVAFTEAVIDRPLVEGDMLLTTDVVRNRLCNCTKQGMIGNTCTHLTKLLGKQKCIVKVAHQTFSFSNQQKFS